MNKLSAMLIGVALPLVVGCQRQPTEVAPPQATPETGEGVTPAAGAPEPGGASEASWKIESGPADAPVQIEAFYPFNEDHAWVKQLNQKILDTYPGQVHITQIDWFTEEGGKYQSDKGLPACGLYTVNGEVVAKKSQPLGGWTDQTLLDAVAKALESQGAKGDASASEPTEKEAPAPAGGGE